MTIVPRPAAVDTIGAHLLAMARPRVGEKEAVGIVAIYQLSIVSRLVGFSRGCQSSEKWPTEYTVPCARSKFPKPSTS